MNSKHLLLIVVMLGTITASSIGLYAYKTHNSARSEALSCIGTLQEQCASEDFLRGWSHWQRIRVTLASSNGSESVSTREQMSDEFSGLTQRLQGMIPKGTQWNETKRRFTLLPTGAEQSPAPAGTPAVPTQPLPVPTPAAKK